MKLKLVLSAIFALCVSVTAFAQTSNTAAQERRVVELINIERAKQNLLPLAWHDTLASIARAHSEDMLRGNFVSSTGSDGSTHGDRIRRGGITNITWWNSFNYGGNNTPEQRITAWMNSSAHRNIILRRGLSHIGVGIVQRPAGSNASQTTYWSVKFIDMLPATAFSNNINVQAAIYRPVTTIRSISQSQRTEIRNYTYTLANGKSTTIFYTMPQTVNNETKVLFAMRPESLNDRSDAEGTINTMRYLSETENIIVIVPEFERGTFPAAEYQRLNISGNIENPERWMPREIDNMYLDFCRRFNIRAGKYILFGQSAGAQFTHRATMLSQSSLMDYSIAANTGTLTFPDEQTDYILGIRDLLPLYSNLINQNFARRMYILIGNQDNDPNHWALASSAGAARQGNDRYERMLNFYQASKDYCERYNLPFNWKLIIMDGVGHGTAGTRPYVIDIVKEIYDRNSGN